MAMIDDAFAGPGPRPGACRQAGRLRPTGNTVCFGRCLIATMLVLLLAASAGMAWAASAEQEGPAETSRQGKLWNEAEAFAKAGDIGQAALYYKHYWQTFPESPRAAEALWQAARLYKELALASQSPDWLRVKELFHAYIVDFPDSRRQAEAYLEVGNSYFYMGFFREAQNYYTLFLQEYPKHSEVRQVRYMRGRALLEVGKFSQASQDFAKLRLSKDRLFRLRGEAGQAYVHLFQGQWHDALGIFKKIVRHNPDYYLVAPEILRDMGIAAIRVGNIDEGRANLLHYLNIVPRAQADEQAYFEVAESFLRQGDLDNARTFYEMVIDRGKADNRYAILSTFRLAQYKATNLDKMTPKERQAFFKEKGDKPFLEVLDSLYREPLAQEARFALFQRYVERQEWELAYNLGKSYLRYDGAKKQRAEVVDTLGSILIARISKLLADGKNEEVRRIYEQEYETVRAYPRAKLLILIGQAFERDTLYDQASVIYYRALGREISDADKVQLYYRRAEVYLANHDLKSAQRLLKYLRRLYQDQPAIAEVNWLSGRLRLQQKRPEDALEFFKMAVESAGGLQKRDHYADSYLRQLFAMDDLERVADLIAMFQQDTWLAAEQIQYWYGRLGLALTRRGEAARAAGIYKRALAQGLPEDSQEAQPIHLHLGDLLVEQGRYKEAVGHYRLAQGGKDRQVATMAEARLNESRIRKAMADVDAMF